MVGVGAQSLRDTESLIRVENLVMEFPGPKGAIVHAVSDVSFDVAEGETIGIVGESGCGKSTTAKAVIQMPRPTDGKVMFEGEDLATLCLLYTSDAADE